MCCHEQVLGGSKVLRALLSRTMEAKTSPKEVMLCEEISFCVEGERMTYGAGDVLRLGARALDELKRREKRILVWA